MGEIRQLRKAILAASVALALLLPIGGTAAAAGTAPSGTARPAPTLTASSTDPGDGGFGH